MTIDEEELEPSIDLFLYGALIKKKRLDLGYRKAEDFVDAMKIKTGYEVSKDILYRMEAGKREPTINFLIAFNMMCGKPLLDSSILEMCLPREWVEQSSEDYYKPYSFKDYMDDLHFNSSPF